MIPVTRKRNSIYFQLLQLLVGAAVAAVLAFFALNYAGEYVIDNYYYNSGYEQKKDEGYIQELQQYIDNNQLTTRDTDELNLWVKKQKVINIRIYKDDIQVFDSEYPETDMLEEDVIINENDWEVYYTVEFADGRATVSVSGVYEYQFYNYAMIAELVISFVLFLILVLLGIRKKMNYISKLSHEIEILEGGSLDYKITVKGKDEISALAEGLDNMRLSFKNLVDEETEIVRENQKIVTEMSHDLRTPVTSIMLYTEILKKGKYQNEIQLMEYLEKIDKKAHRMKQLTDHLFAYALVAGSEKVELEEPESYEMLFYDLFSETCNFLQQRGFQIEFQVKWMEKNLRVCTNYIVRIMDNITSNIIKYADPSEPVVIQSVYDDKRAGFIFENAVRQTKERVESNCVGIQSIKNMMKKMGGICLIQQEGDRFRIEILFPVCMEPQGMQ